MTKTDDILLELNRAAAKYTQSVRAFQYKKKTYRLITNYVATPSMRCAVCGGYPTHEVSAIESDDGKILRVGNDCIDRLTGRNISEWFDSFRQKRESVMANRERIDQLSLTLNAQAEKDLLFQITDGLLRN